VDPAGRPDRSVVSMVPQRTAQARDSPRALCFVSLMRSPGFAAALLVAACAAPERRGAAEALQCLPPRDLVEIASAKSVPLDAPAAVGPREAQAAAAVLALEAFASMLGGSSPATLVAPAGTVQLAAPGWRQYEGCGRTVVCFDGGLCSLVEPASAQAVARAVPSLMGVSARELVPAFIGADCGAHVLPVRRGALAWTLHACGKVVACVATRADDYECLGALGQREPRPVRSPSADR
jgi:hypothetical protein